MPRPSGQFRRFCLHINKHTASRNETQVDALVSHGACTPSTRYIRWRVLRGTPSQLLKGTGRVRMRRQEESQLAVQVSIDSACRCFEAVGQCWSRRSRQMTDLGQLTDPDIIHLLSVVDDEKVAADQDRRATRDPSRLPLAHVTIT